ncbi:MAG: aminoglycoside phosphotransferase family protein [Flavobacteriales bacterium]|nr:aminoglycoside phosphotransferase family protein [Flavobacteriales bacterium]NUQ13981.1 aminoglycoside phosphotransferase family protein [Flavobacteriales bacterium]
MRHASVNTWHAPMSLDRETTLRTLCEAFGIALNGHDCMDFGNGLINSTYLLKDRHGDNDWILQRVNTAVFKQPELIAYNNYLAADHLRRHFPDYRFMEGKRTAEGKDLFQDAVLGAWRVFPYIRNTVSHDNATTPHQAYSAAQQFGRLTRNLDGIYTGAFKVIIPDFHHLPKRWAHFQEALRTAAPERLDDALETIAFYTGHEELVHAFDALLRDPQVSTRITHNDTKLNNVLFDRDSNEAVCVVDLDTLMPGKALFDLGDMIRTFISPAAEDDPDPAHCTIRPEIFQALVEGWFSEMAPLLSPAEKARVFLSGQLLMMEQGVRFLTDFLENDVYYRTLRPGHNLDRARNQMHLLAAYTARKGELEAMIAGLVG